MTATQQYNNAHTYYTAVYRTCLKSVVPTRYYFIEFILSLTKSYSSRYPHLSQGTMGGLSPIP